MPGSPGPTRPSVQRPYFPVVTSRAAVIPVSSLVLHSVRNLLEYFTHLGKKVSDEEYKSRPTRKSHIISDHHTGKFSDKKSWTFYFAP